MTTIDSTAPVLPEENTADASVAPVGEASVTNDQAATAEATVAKTIAAPATPGEMLKRAREAANLSVGDIAARLRMSTKQIQALESAEYVIIPTGTFLRGFVRAYAKQVHCDPDGAIALLESSHTHAVASNAAPIVAPSQNIKLARGEAEIVARRTRYAVVALVLLVIGVISFYWWQYVRPYRSEGGRPPAERAGSAPTSSPVALAVASAESAARKADVTSEASKAPVAIETSAAVRADAPANRPPATQTASPETSQPVAKTASLVATQSLTTKATLVPNTARSVDADGERVPAKGEGALGFTFSGESWVEVLDGAGKMILSRRFRAGEVGEAIGKAPMSIVIGNATVTRMAFNGKEFDLVPHTRVSVARLTVK